MDQTDAGTWQLPRNSRRSKPELIEERIEELIERGVLPYDSPLPSEQELANRFKVSRSSVRAALIRLELRGLVSVEQGIGWRVTAPRPPIPADEADQLRREAETVIDARIGLEPHAARLAAKRATEKDLKEIADLNEEHAAAVRAGDVDDMVRTDEEFHRLIIRAARNELIEDLYKIIEERARTLRQRVIDGASTDAMRRSIDGHALVVRFLHHRDPSAAVAMEEHIKAFAQP